MELILVQKVRNLGNLGDKVKVKPGYGRNYLVPQGKAVFATATNIADFGQRRAEFEAKANGQLASAQARKETLESAVVTIPANASTEGKLYGSVGPRDIAEAFSTAGHPLSKAEVILPEGPIRRTGEHEVHIALHADVHCNVKVNVVPES